MTICLRRRLPGASCDRYPRARRAASSPSYLVLLRAGFVWPAGHPAAGGLLPHHFTLTDSGPPETIAASGVISVALSFGSPRLGVAQRPAPRLRLSPVPSTRSARSTRYQGRPCLPLRAPRPPLAPEP